MSKKRIAQSPSPTPSSLPNIEALVVHGDITIGVLDPVGCVATAADEDRCLAMLIRRPDETLTELLTRLDRAIEEAINKDILIDEINSLKS